MTDITKTPIEKRKPYTGPERREYCEQHCNVASTARNSVPRWAFISSLGTMVTVALIFASWHVSSLDKLKVEIAATQAKHNKETNTRLADAQLRYGEDVERFIRAVGENRSALRVLSQDIGDVKLQLTEFKTKQDLVLKKIKLAE